MKTIATATTAAFLMLAATTAFAGKADDTLNWATDKEVAVVDPYFNNTRELLIQGQMAWDTLVLYNTDTGEYEPLIATSWDWTSNTVAEFKLREDITFHDGSTLDADDVVYTINFIADEANGVLNQSVVSWMKEATKIDQYTVRLELKEPFPTAMAYLSNEISIMPDGHYDGAPDGADGNKDYSGVKPVGSGPYKVVDIKPGEYVSFEKFEDYIEDGAKGTPSIGKINFRTITEANTQMGELMTGGLDWIWDVPKEQASRLEDTGQATVENAKTLRISYLTFDVQGKSGEDFFTDKLVRQAVAHAINRESIAKNLVGPASVAIDSACHPDQFGCSQDVTKYDYDPEKAKELLTEAGYPDGFEFDLYGYRQREFTEAVIGDLAAVGIRANLNWLQYSALLEIVRKGETPVSHMTWGSSSIPDVAAITSQFFEGGPDDPANDPRTAEPLKRGDTSLDPEVRKAAYAEALGVIADEVYWLPMFTYAKYYAFSNDLDFTPTADEMPRFYAAKWK